MTLSSARDAILDVAIPIFADKGYDAASVREICGAAGANLAAVNYHFGGKAALYREAVLRVHQSANRSEMPTLDDFSGDSDAALRAWIGWYITRSVSRDGDAATRLLLREAAQPSEELGGVVESVIHPIYRGIEDILRAILPADTDVRTLKIQCLSTIGQCLVHRVCREMIDRLPVDPPLGPDDAEAIAGIVIANTRAALGLADRAPRESAS